MEFYKTEKTINNTTNVEYFIDNKRVDEKTYYSLLEDSFSNLKNIKSNQDCDNSEMCEHCEMMFDLIEDIRESDNEYAFEILSSFGNESYKNGYTDALRGLAASMMDLADEIEGDESEEEKM